MKFVGIIPYYLYWHYTKGIKDLMHTLKNILIFEFYFFSIDVLAKTLFAPFQKIHETYSKNMFEVENILSSLVVNIVMRIIGFFIRMFLIVTYLLATIATILATPLVFFAWLIMPFALIFLIGVSIWSFLTHK